PRTSRWRTRAKPPAVSGVTVRTGRRSSSMSALVDAGVTDFVAGEYTGGADRARPRAFPAHPALPSLAPLASPTRDGASEREALHEVADAGEAVPWRGGRPGRAAA